MANTAPTLPTNASKCNAFGQQSGIVILLTSTTVKVKIAFLRLLEEVSLC